MAIRPRAAFTFVALLAARLPAAPADFERLEHQTPRAEARLLPGVSRAVARLNITEPVSPGDSIGVSIPTGRVQATLLTPAGVRVSAGNAAAAGFRWTEHEDVHLGTDEDRGRIVTIEFTRSRAAASYTVELAATAPNVTAQAHVWLARQTETAQEYRRRIAGIAGAHLAEIAPSGDSFLARIELTDDEPMSIFDVFVPTASSRVSIRLPDGSRLEPGQPTPGVEWRTITQRAGSRADRPKDDLREALYSSVLSPDVGVHRLIEFRNAPKGIYEIRSSSAARVAFIPMVRMLNDGPPPPGEVRLTRPSGSFECYVAEPCDLKVELRGEMTGAPEFAVRIEHTPKGTNVPRAAQNAPFEFRRGDDGYYHAEYVPSEAAFERIEVAVKTRNAGGQSVEDQVIYPGRSVPLAARADLLEASTVADAGGGIARVALSLGLNVHEAGEYYIVFEVTDPGQRKVVEAVRAQLTPGRQELKTAIEGWQIRNQLLDGPYTARIESAVLLRDHTKILGADGLSRPVSATVREQWSPGALYGDDQVSLHGILPAASGRFEMAEIRWDVTTPGGLCHWQAYMSPEHGDILSAASASTLPLGKSTLLFHFDGADIAAAGAGAGPWTFQATARCDNRKEHAQFRRATIDVAPATFEPLRRAVALQGVLSVDSPRPGVWTANLSVNSPERGAPFTLVAPPELQARLTNVYNSAPSHFATLEMTLAPGAPPGRYFVEVTATSGQEHSTRRVPVVVYSAKTP